ncbi:MAG TPA: efflux RND transporter periplasmic adaptor subunit [Chitinophagaceae bacterium]|nr:efflux RND transporter periplasmic adaptor subunit [Chitinophagaceae bacterium]
MRTFVGIILLSVLLYACTGREEQKKSDRAEAQPVPVRLLAVAGDSFSRQIPVSGLVTTQDEARLSFKIGGIIDQVLVREGQYVKRGQLLATLKPNEIAAQVSQARLAVEKADRDYQRLLNLYRDSVATLEQLQNARTGLDLARQSLQQVAFNQAYARIVAPADGFVARRLLNPGELTGPGNVVLVMGRVSGSAQWILQAGVADRDWDAIRTGDSAQVTLDAFPGQVFPAVVTRRGLAADPVTGSFPVELSVGFGDRRPAMGLFASAVIRTTNWSREWRIPYEALLEADGNRGYVFVTEDGHRVHRVEVSIGSLGNQSVTISRGLEGHRYVVTSGSPYLSDSAEITVAP